jgi:16S rRNA processing protein RimM
MIRENFLPVGFIVKPHGIRGQLIIRLDEGIVDPFNTGKYVFFEIDDCLIPFFIKELEFIGDRAIIAVEFLENPDEARRYSGKKVYIQNSAAHKIKAEEMDFPDYTGYSFRDNTSGNVGTIKEFIENPLNPLLVGTDGSAEFYLPLHNDFIINIDHERKLIVFSLPEGLMEI